MVGKVTVVIERAGRAVKIVIQPNEEWDSIIHTAWNAKGFVQLIKESISLPRGLRIINDNSDHDPISIDERGLVLSPRALWEAIDRRSEYTWSIYCDTLIHAHDTFQLVSKVISKIMSQIVAATQDIINKDTYEKTSTEFTIRMNQSRQ